MSESRGHGLNDRPSNDEMKKSKRHRDDASSEGEEEREKSHKHHKKAKSSSRDTDRDYKEEFEHRERQWQVVGSSEDEGSDSDSSSSSSDRDKHKKAKKEAKKSHKHKKSKKSKKEKKSKDKGKEKHRGKSINQNEYGKYGIIREEHYFQKQREFDAYMEEVRGVPGVLMLSKREMMDHFKTFMEDYNTATMPHDKFYNYERWELASYQQKQQQTAARAAAGAAGYLLDDEENKRAESKRRKQLEEQQEFNRLRSQISQDKAKQDSMKRQAELNTELQIAYKRGDMVTVRRLERMLTPDVEVVVKHPWA